jgi:hypothetical protein
MRFSLINLILGDCLEKMRKMGDNSIDCIVTDPPYFINFMSKDFDKFKDNIAKNPIFWKEALRVCKPGANLLAFGADRTHHHLMIALEEAGWTIKTCIYWIFGSGFPKSHNFGCKCKGIPAKEQCYRESGAIPEQSGTQDRRGQTCEICQRIIGFEGFGTALKPAAEIIIMAMKPLDGTYKENASKWGLAGLNIDDSRIPTNELKNIQGGFHRGLMNDDGWKGNKQDINNIPSGRWPANLILGDEEVEAMLDEQSGVSKSTGGKSGNENAYGGWGKENHYGNEKPGFGDSGGASRFFYCPKASKSERGADNIHPTIKPIRLMEYLIKLVMPKHEGAVLLDPFVGSGSTLVAAKNLGYKAIGIEMNEEYFEIAKRRVKYQEDQLKLF